MPDFLSQAAAFGPGGLLGLDLGTKTIGVASCGPERTLASPVTVIRRTKFGADAAEVIRLADERRAGGLVVGLPLNMDGSQGPRAQGVRDLATNILRLADIPILFQDERMSSQAVTRGMLDADMSRRRRAQEVDRLAAAYILQGVLDRLRSQRKTP